MLTLIKQEKFLLLALIAAFVAMCGLKQHPDLMPAYKKFV